MSKCFLIYIDMIKIKELTNFALAEPAISAKAMQIHYD